VPALLSSLIQCVQSQPDNPPRRTRLGRTGQETLLDALSQVPDPRDARGVRHRLPTILALTLAAVLAGHTSFYAIGQWIADAGQKDATDPRGTPGPDLGPLPRPGREDGTAPVRPYRR